MSIGTDRFGAQGLFLTFDPYQHEAPPLASVFALQCRFCGFELADPADSPRHACPKCHCNAWEHFVRPGSLLQRADMDQ